MSIHAQNECQVFTENKSSFPPPNLFPFIYKTILVLRLLLLKKHSFSTWDDSFGKLESHCEIRKEKKHCIHGTEKIWENFLHFYKYTGIIPFDKDDIFNMIGVINVNAFGAFKAEKDDSANSGKFRFVCHIEGCIKYYSFPNQ